MTIPRPTCIFILPLAFQRLKIYIDLCPVEISGLGEVELRGDRLVVTDLFLIPQTGTPSETELDPEHLCEFLAKHLLQGREPASLRVWWHSHGGMDVNWSRTDQETIGKFPGDFLISIVGNQRGEFLCRLDIFAPSPQTLNDLPLVALDELGLQAPREPGPLRREVLAEIREKVRIFLPVEPVELQEWVIASEPEHQIEVDLDSLRHDQDSRGLH